MRRKRLEILVRQVGGVLQAGQAQPRRGHCTRPNRLAGIAGIRASRVVFSCATAPSARNYGQERAVQFKVIIHPVIRPTSWWRRRTLAMKLLLWSASATGLLFVFLMT